MSEDYMKDIEYTIKLIGLWGDLRNEGKISDEEYTMVKMSLLRFVTHPITNTQNEVCKETDMGVSVRPYASNFIAREKFEEE
jgi:hypothetical protein